MAELEPLENYEATSQPLAWITPGTVLHDGIPEGWSAVLLKSHYRVAAGDADRVAAMVKEGVAALFTVIAVRTELQPNAEGAPRYRIAGLGLGVGGPVNGQEVIFSKDTHSQLGANLSVAASRSLAMHEKRLSGIRLLARSSTLAVVEYPTFGLRDGQHCRIRVRGALLVDPLTGRLDTLLWRLDEDEHGGYVGPVGAVQWLEPNLVEQAVLHADAGRFSLGGLVPKGPAAFAIVSLPPGRRQVVFSPRLQQLAAEPHPTPEWARELETLLRETIR
jgi:hypothetical protein